MVAYPPAAQTGSLQTPEEAKIEASVQAVCQVKSPPEADAAPLPEDTVAEEDKRMIMSLAEDNKIAGSILNETTIQELIRLMKPSVETEFEEDSPWGILFAKEFSLIGKAKEKLEAEKDPAKREEIAANIEQMKKSEASYRAELKGHYRKALSSCEQKDPQSVLTHLNRLFTTLLLVNEGGRIDHFKMRNGYQAIRKVELNDDGLPTHDGKTVGSEFIIRCGKWDGHRYAFSGKMAASGHFRKELPSFSGKAPMAILPSNTIAANIVMSVQNVIDHIMYGSLTAGLNCHPNVMRLNRCLFRAAREAGILPAKKPEGELCEGGRSDMDVEDLKAWIELKTEFFADTTSVDDFDPDKENLKKLMDMTEGDLQKTKVKLSFDKLNSLAKDPAKAENTCKVLKSQIHEAGGKAAALVLEWGGLIAFNKDGFRNIGFEGNSMLDKEKTRALCRFIWEHIAPLCKNGIQMQSGYPCDQQDGKDTPAHVAFFVTAAWVEQLAGTHPTKEEFGPGVGDCALSLPVAQAVSDAEGEHCPGSFYQPVMPIVPIKRKMLTEYQQSPLRRKMCSFAFETWTAVRRQQMM